MIHFTRGEAIYFFCLLFSMHISHFFKENLQGRDSRDPNWVPKTPLNKPALVHNP